MNTAVRKFDKLIRNSKIEKSEDVPHLSETIKFTDDELQGINSDFREQFKATGNCARVIKYLCGYEIRYLRDGYNITVSDLQLKRAKEKFWESLLS